MSTALAPLAQKLAATLNIDNGTDLITTLKQTAFKGNATEAQLAALLIVANQYGLNPWTKEIYAFPDKHNGIVPVVGIDGWSRIINSHPQLDGIEFEQTEESCTCTIWRKDRSRTAARITERMSECKRDGIGPWKTHPHRMLRHKALIQCARVAFGYTGITEPDEAERIIQERQKDTSIIEGEVIQHKAPDVLPDYPQDRLEMKLPTWRGKNPKEMINMIQSRYRLSEEQKAQILALDHLPNDSSDSSANTF